MIITLLGLRIDAPFPRKKSIPIIRVSLSRIFLEQRTCFCLKVDWPGSANRCTAALLSMRMQPAGSSNSRRVGGQIEMNHLSTTMAKVTHRGQIS